MTTPRSCKGDAHGDRSAAAAPTVLIVEAVPIFRRGLMHLIDAERDLRVVDAVVSDAAALAAAKCHAPDLVILELAPGPFDDLALLNRLTAEHPLTRVLVFSDYDELVYAERTLRAGAGGFVCRSEPDAILLGAMRTVLAGDVYLSPRVEALLARRFLGVGDAHPSDPISTLTDRQFEVFRAIGEGKTTRAIAKDLTLSVKTIESHIENLKDKLVINSRVALARRAIWWRATGRGG